MKILIRSRERIQKMSQTPFCATALISICDVGDAAVNLYNSPQYILNVAFNDVDNDIMVDDLRRPATEDERVDIEKKYGMISDEQAIQIAQFYLSICDTVSTLICQCEHGQSRSAAIAAAVMEFRSRRGVDVFSDDRYYPNKVVYRKVLQALKGANSEH